MSRKLLCAVYAAIALVALVATWSQNIAFFRGGGSFLGFWEATKANPATKSVTVDLFLFGLAVLILMVIEARKHNIRFLWAYVFVGFAIAISVAFPLFLIARELRLEKSDATQLRQGDTILLTVFATAILAFTYWVELV